MVKIRGGKYDGSPMKLLPHLLALSGISGLLTAGESGDYQVITLKDKSVLRAQVVEMSGGFYHAKSPVLGDLKIPSSEIISICAEQAAARPAEKIAPEMKGPSGALSETAPADLAGLQSAVAAKVKSLVATPEGMNSLMEFSRNPEVKSVMNDPQVMQSIKAGDYNALMNSPAIKQLLDDPQARGFIQSIMKPKPADLPTPAPAGRPSPTE